MRTTVPMSIIKKFNLKAGDKLLWKLKVEEGELVIIVKAVKESVKLSNGFGFFEEKPILHDSCARA